MYMIRLRVLLEGGKYIWQDADQTSATIIDELEANDIYGDIRISEGNVAWVLVDQAKTPLSDFYTYEEVMEKNIDLAENALLWRTFRTVIDEDIVLHPDLPEHALFRELIIGGPLFA